MKTPFVESGEGHFNAISDLVDLSKPVKILKVSDVWTVIQDGKEICRTNYLCLNGCVLSSGISGYVCDPRETDKTDLNWETITHDTGKNAFTFLDHEITKATFVDLESNSTIPILAFEPK